MKRFLVVEDDEMSRVMLQHLLSEFAPCDTAKNGKKGLDLFKAALPSLKPFDLICVDLLMPEMNGLSLIRNIRELEKGYTISDKQRTVIFVVSSSNSPWEKAELILDDLCDDYIVKPFSRNIIIEKLKQYGLFDNNSQTPITPKKLDTINQYDSGNEAYEHNIVEIKG